jgi:MFS-type transporter involved in bile tolerance (Atg22 family)
MTIFYGPASVVGPISGGVLADITGSYRLTYILLAVTFAFASLAAWRLPRIEKDN